VRPSLPGTLLTATLLVSANLVAPVALAQSVPVDPATAHYQPGTNDAWLDAQLADINRYAERYPESFLDELVRYAGISYDYASAMMKQQGWQGGDLYFACFWGKAIDLGCRPLVRLRAQHPDLGWAERVATLPVEPGRLHWRAVRHAVVDSYQRWDRPITLDAVLRRQMAERAAAEKGGTAR
jgi:hypothetical protein